MCGGGGLHVCKYVFVVVSPPPDVHMRVLMLSISACDGMYVSGCAPLINSQSPTRGDSIC